MIQSRRHSLLESVSNTAIGYGVALGSQLLIFPWYGIHLPLTDNLAIGAWFTLVSIARGYVLRRWFTRRTEATQSTMSLRHDRQAHPGVEVRPDPPPKHP